jgi:hypothetical protein
VLINTRTFSLWDVVLRRLVVSWKSFGTTYPFHFYGSSCTIKFPWTSFVLLDPCRWERHTFPKCRKLNNNKDNPVLEKKENLNYTSVGDRYLSKYGKIKELSRKLLAWLTKVKTAPRSIAAAVNIRVLVFVLY